LFRAEPTTTDTARIATCEACGTEFEAPGKRGRLPRFCPEHVHQRRLAASLRWKHRNAERVKAYRDEYHAAHREETNARSRRWRQENAERVREYRRKLYEERQRATNTATVLAYRARNPGKHAEIENRRRARLLGSFIEPVSVAEIRARDGGLCGICRLPVALEEESLDHVLPLALGGRHERANVQLAHRVCNSRKGARISQAL
jgi:5-methylcytosine-specific restriction endonuclease McrA